MSRIGINNGDTGLAVRNALNGMTSELYPARSLALSASGMLGRPLTCCSSGTSLMTGNEGLAATLQYALMVHDAYLTFDHRKVLTSVSDATVVANRGDSYATSTAGSTHMVGAQRTQFNADVAAGRRFDIMFTDGGLYNDTPTNQASLDTCMTRMKTFLADFFNPAGNDGMVAIVCGTGGINPVLARSWATMCQQLERSSGGRVRFADFAAQTIAPGATATAWSWRNGNGLGGASTDGTHPSFSGARYQAEALIPILRSVCPATWPRGGTFGNPLYNPATFPFGDVLGTGAGMLGNQGLDQNLNGGDFSGNVVGQGTGSINNTWYLNFNTGSTVTPDIVPIGPTGFREQRLTLGGTAGGNSAVQFSFKVQNADVTGGQAARRFMAGIEVDYQGVTGAVQPTLWIGNGPATDLLPVANGDIQDGLPDAFTGTLKLRFLRALALPAGDINFGLYMGMRAGASSGVIRIRRPFFSLVEKEV